jgi:hypothetical protein
MPEPDRPITSESLSSAIGPISILKQAITRVPALKYALGIAGIAAALAIIKTLITDLRLALFGIILMLVLMTVLFIFAKLTSFAAKEIRLPAIALLWFSLVLTITTASFLFTSVFFNWPINLKHVVDGQAVGTVPAPTNSNVAIVKSTYLRGVIKDLNTKQGLADAVIEVELLPGKTFRTGSDGGFSIEDISADPGDSARVLVRKEGYAPRDEYVTLPGPKTIYLETNK